MCGRHACQENGEVLWNCGLQYILYGLQYILDKYGISIITYELSVNHNI